MVFRLQALLLLLSFSLFAEEIVGRVVRVADGDTLTVIVQSVGSRVPRDRIEYRAGRTLPVGSRTPAPVNDIWPDTGYWLSTNSNKRHNRNCENYRKTRGYPCRKTEGTPCGKCEG